METQIRIRFQFPLGVLEYVFDLGVKGVVEKTEELEVLKVFVIEGNIVVFGC